MTNKLGLHAFVWTANWTDEAARRAIGLTAELGFDLIELSAMDIDEIDAVATKRELQASGLGAALSFGLDESMDVSSTDAERRRRGEERLLQGVRLASEVGATHVCGILYSAFGKYAVPPTSEGTAHSIDVIRRVAETARDGGVTLGLEIVNRYETNLLNTARPFIFST